MVDFLALHAADRAGDEVARGIELRRIVEEFLEGSLLLELGVEALGCVAGEPADDFVYFGLGSPLLLDLGDVEHVDAGEAH